MSSKDTREFILVAPDCPVDKGTVPQGKRASKPIVVHQYEVLSQHPYEYTERGLSHEVHYKRRGKQEGELNLSKYDLRRSRLAKEFGWGLHYNEDRKLALVGCETEEYERLARGAQNRGTAVVAWQSTKGNQQSHSQEATKQSTTPKRQATFKRQPIPKSVKMYTWQRDGGRCVECGSKEKLEYDHIIPLSKGGSNTERNLQLLCEQCNRSKGSTIG